MPGKRQPTDVVLAAGRKHLSRAEEARRRAEEVSLPPAKTARPPAWLAGELKKPFRALGRQLIGAGLYTQLDGDSLGRYVTAQHQWELASQAAEEALQAGKLEDADAWGRVQDRYFRQARACAGDMGLTVTSRCRLVVPKAAEQEGTENAFLRLLRPEADRCG